MAEALLRAKARERGVPVEVRSAGVAAADGVPVSAHAAEVLRERQVPHEGMSRPVTAEAVAWADLILTMTAGHKRMLLERYPEALEKTHTLKEYVEDRPEVLAEIAELERLYTEWHLRQAIGGKLSDEERARLLELEARVPDFDIADPFGGSLDTYRKVAEELDAALEKLMAKLGKEPAKGQDNGETGESAVKGEAGGETGGSAAKGEADGEAGESAAEGKAGGETGESAAKGRADGEAGGANGES
jgi:protein-tyrosine phosphatase